jgi:hypothetical protein
MKKLAAIYERKGVLFVMAAHKTKAGFWIDDEQVVSLVGPTMEELGRVIEEALGRSRDGVPTPLPTVRLDKPLLKAAGVGSWATFMNLSRHVSISSDDGMLTATPYRNLGSKGGFGPEADAAVPTAASRPVLGQLVIDLLLRTS